MHKKSDSLLDKYKVLVVDDDKLLSQLICAHLESDGFITIPAVSLQEAKNIISTDDRVDMVLLDYQLGDGNGIDFLQFNEVVPYIEKARVIMISASDDIEFLEGCFSKGVSDYIIKPINFKLLSLKAKSLIQSVKLKNVINKQNEELSKYKSDSLREEAIAKFTYEYLMHQGAEQVPGVSMWLQPSSAFSGDAVLVKTSPTGDLFIIIADATGHGLSAAITIMPLITTFQSMVSKGFHLQSIMTEINRKLVTNTPDDRFVAAVGIEIKKFNKELFVWNGGMPSVYVMDEAGIVRRFKSMHLALGILEDESFDATVEELTLGEKNRLFSCSDGLIEQINSRGEPFSKRRLVDLLQNNQADLLGAVISCFDAHVEGSTHGDDISMCLVDVDKYLSSIVSHQMELQTGTRKNDGKFLWNIKICGDRLGTCEVIPLVQHLLQHMDITQSLSQKLFIVVSEMLNNAIDHGVLGLASNLKELDNGFLEYHKERELRLADVSPDSYVILSLECENKKGIFEVLVRVEDSGNGYAFSPRDDNAGLMNSGRGLQLIHNLASSVHIKAPGNIIEAVLK